MRTAREQSTHVPKRLLRLFEDFGPPDNLAWILFQCIVRKHKLWWFWLGPPAVMSSFMIIGPRVSTHDPFFVKLLLGGLYSLSVAVVLGSAFPAGILNRGSLYLPVREAMIAPQTSADLVVGFSRAYFLVACLSLWLLPLFWCVTIFPSGVALNSLDILVHLLLIHALATSVIWSMAWNDLSRRWGWAIVEVFGATMWAFFWLIDRPGSPLVTWAMVAGILLCLVTAKAERDNCKRNLVRLLCDRYFP